MKSKQAIILSLVTLSIIFGSCIRKESTLNEIIKDPYLTAQAEIREVINAIIKDAEEVNIEGLKAVHLESEKFSKFGPRKFERQDFTGTNKSEEAFFSSISNYLSRSA